MAGMAPLFQDATKAIFIAGGSVPGLLTAATLNAGSQALAHGQKITSVVIDEPGDPDEDMGPPSMSPPDGDELSFSEGPQLSLNRTASYKFALEAERQREAELGRYGFVTPYGLQITKRMQGLIRHMNKIAGQVLANRAYRAAGTTSGNVFATDIKALANVNQLFLDTDGIEPSSSSHSVLLSSTARTAYMQLSGLNNAAEAGSDDLLRRGVLGEIHGMAIRGTHGTASHTKGTGSGYVLDGAHARGATHIKLKTGTGTIPAGDVLTIGGVSYVTHTGLVSGYVDIAAPGLAESVADGATVTISDSHVSNIALRRDAVEIAVRAPAQVNINGVGFGLAKEEFIVTDPVTKISFAISIFAGDRMATMRIACVWDVFPWRPDGIHKLMSGV